MKSRARRALSILIAATAGAAAVGSAANAWGQLPVAPADARSEARERFDRGLRLFNEGDNAGALAEFKRANDLVPNQVVLYNIGLVFAVMGRPVDAVDALDRVIASPGGLTADQLARARQTRDEQAQRIAQLVVVTESPATIEVDGVEAGKTPLAQPLRVAGGVHVVGAVATGYAPVRREVTLASGEKTEVRLELVPMQGRLAHVEVKTHLPQAGVFIDGQLVARTPLLQSLTVAPGPHAVELRRPGYVTARADLTLGDGAAAEVALEPAEDATALVTSGGALALDVSEAHANVAVDGRARGLYAGPLRLPSGAHVVMVERGGFEPMVREVEVQPGRTTALRLVLEPTPEWRASYASRTTTQRTWGWVSTVAGLAIAGGGVGFLVWNQAQSDNAHADALSLRHAIDTNTDPCKGSSGGNAPQVCSQEIANDNDAVSAASQRVWVGYVAIGVGAAASAFGVYLLLSNDDVHRYDRPATPVSGRVVPFGWPAPGGGGLGLAGTM